LAAPIHHGALQFQPDPLRALLDGQTPKVMFITCSDSRLVLSMLTGTGPGELFVMRNAGNIVPPYGAGDVSSAATIEYAIEALGVEHIIVCGHAKCGAVAAAMNPEFAVNMPAVKEWLRHAEVARRVVEARKPEEADRAMCAVERNVVAQLTSLQTHPSVAAALATKHVVLHGWVYTFEGGIMREYDAGSDTFVPLRDLPNVPFAFSRT
jgi:carbonic anhydrase